MELTKQVPSLELCKKLKELGWEQDKSYFAWKIFPGGSGQLITYKEIPDRGFWRDGGHDLIDAPSVAELGEALGKAMLIRIDGRVYFWYCLYVSVTNAWQPRIADFENLMTYWNNGNKNLNTEADARAKMWIYLKENNLIT